MDGLMRSIVCVVVATAALLPTAAPAYPQTSGITIAVFRFGNAGAYGESRDTTEARRLRIGTMLASALEQHGIKSITPRQTWAAVGQDSVGRARRIDAATATRVARELGAQYAVTGSFVDHFGRIRVNALLVDAASGAIVKAFTNSDPALQGRENLPDIVSAQAASIAEAVNGER
jgi:TolB-like protein